MAKAATKKIPEGMHSLTPHLVCAGAAGAIEFYKKAFNAKEEARLPGPDGKLMHAAVRIGRAEDQHLTPALSRKIKLLKAGIDKRMRALIEAGVADGSIRECDARMTAFALADVVMGFTVTFATSRRDISIGNQI